MEMDYHFLCRPLEIINDINGTNHKIRQYNTRINSWAPALLFISKHEIWFFIDVKINIGWINRHECLASPPLPP
jgi:hypothetical protein